MFAHVSQEANAAKKAQQADESKEKEKEKEKDKKASASRGKSADKTKGSNPAASAAPELAVPFRPAGDLPEREQEHHRADRDDHPPLATRPTPQQQALGERVAVHEHGQRTTSTVTADVASAEIAVTRR